MEQDASSVLREKIGSVYPEISGDSFLDDSIVPIAKHVQKDGRSSDAKRPCYVGVLDLEQNAERPADIAKLKSPLL
jgi:hypothetical protein